MQDEKDDKNAQLDQVRGNSGLAHRSGFIAKRARKLMQKAGQLQSTDGIDVMFPDKNLEAAVREELKKDDGTLTRGDLKRMKDLTVEVADKEIEDLTGLEHAVNLTKLYLSTNKISDVSPLASLTNLTDVLLTLNPLTQESINVHLPNLRGATFDDESDPFAQ